MKFNLKESDIYRSRQVFPIIFNGLREMIYFFKFDIIFDTDCSLLYIELMKIRTLNDLVIRNVL